jgi:hypothetical protein
MAFGRGERQFTRKTVRARIGSRRPDLVRHHETPRSTSLDNCSPG